MDNILGKYFHRQWFLIMLIGIGLSMDAGEAIAAKPKLMSGRTKLG